MTKLNVLIGILTLGIFLISSCGESCEDIALPGWTCDDEGQLVCIIQCEAHEVQLADCNCVDDASKITPHPCPDQSCQDGQFLVVMNGACSCQDLANDPCEDIECGPYATCVSGDCVPINPNVIGVSGSITTDTEWTTGNVYVLSGKVAVENGATLTIQPGVIVKGATGIESNASALIIARGSKIMAAGTAELPIIFTSINDDILPGQIQSPNLTAADNGLWGGLIVLGHAPISAGDGDTEAQIEGIIADDLFGRYGGEQPDDNSGVIKYVSVRHGGALIGADNEINGITFGGVGRGTVVENIEVVANQDDGIEWFGGTVNVINAVVSDCDDDGLDIDQNYAGTITNTFVFQSGDTGGDNALEIDGPENSTFTQGRFTIENATLIDEDGNSDLAADLKSKAQGTINNTTWIGFTKNVRIRSSCESDCSTVKPDAFTNYTTGILSIENSYWVGTGSLADWTTVYGDEDCPDSDGDGESERCMIADAMQTTITDLLTAKNNSVVGEVKGGADAAPFAGWTWVSANGKL